MAGVPLSSDSSEIRFWAYIDAHENYRYILGDAAGLDGDVARSGSAPTPTGNLAAYTSVPGNPNGYTTDAYTPIGDALDSAGPSTSSPSTSRTTPTPSRRAPTPRRPGRR